MTKRARRAMTTAITDAIETGSANMQHTCTVVYVRTTACSNQIYEYFMQVLNYRYTVLRNGCLGISRFPVKQT